MIITKTPFRVSLFGGGTDIPGFFSKEGGHVLGFSINKYSYVTARELPPFFDHKIRLAYSKLEQCKNIDEIEHPLIRTAIKDFNYTNIEVHYDADLPGNSGIASSSSFAVGLANSFFGLKGEFLSKRELADKAILWERKFLKESGGYQDQILTSFGGFNYISFKKNQTYEVEEFKISEELISRFNENILLCFVPKTRLSYKNSVANFISEKDSYNNLIKTREIVYEAIKLFNADDFYGISQLLNEAWSYKRQLKGVTNEMIDSIYERAIQNGAISGKLLGAGGGGFMFFICEEGELTNLRKVLSPLITVPIRIESEGSKLLYLDKNIDR